MRIFKTFTLMLLISLVSACSIFGSDDDGEYYISEQDLYDQALEAIDQVEYVTAVDKLETLESRYPFGRFSEQAQLELIYAYFKKGSEESAIAAADRFIRLHPRHDNLDYVYYMRGLANFEADIKITDRFASTDTSQRDPGAARDSFADFAILIDRYPNSQYAPDARKRMLFLKNQLAAYEIHVARYYIKRQAFIAAVNRGRYVVENYQQTPSVPTALAIMVESYNELGLQDAASHAQQVLNSNYPDYDYAREPKTDPESSLLNTISFGWLGDDSDPQRPNSQTRSESSSKKASDAKATSPKSDTDVDEQSNNK